MGFILLIVFILTIFRAWKQSSLYGRFANRPYDTRKKPHANITDLCSLFTFHSSLFTFHCPLPSHFYSHFSQQFFLTCTSKMLYFCIEFKTGLRR